MVQNYGQSNLSQASSDEDIVVKRVSGRDEFKISQKLLSEVIEPRIKEIFELVKIEIEQSNYKGDYTFGIIFTGGGSKLNGLDDYAQDKLGIPSRIGSPNNDIGGVKNISGLTRYATAIGLILYRDSQLREMPHRKNNSNLMSTSSKIFKKISDYFKKELWSVFFVLNIDEISKN